MRFRSREVSIWAPWLDLRSAVPPRRLAGSDFYGGVRVRTVGELQHGGTNLKYLCGSQTSWIAYLSLKAESSYPRSLTVSVCRFLNMNFSEFSFRNCLKSLASPKTNALNPTKQSKEGSFHCDMTAFLALETLLSEFLDSFSTHSGE
jgi:hypothetical protein